jgi:hypothetical protein
MKTDHLVIEVRNVYGVEHAYPVNDAARIFAKIAGTKTLKPFGTRMTARPGKANRIAWTARKITRTKAQPSRQSMQTNRWKQSPRSHYRSAADVAYNILHHDTRHGRFSQ